MAKVKCVDCNPEYTSYPDDAVYLTEDIPSLGIKAGDTLKKLVSVLYKAMPGLSVGGEVNATDVFTAAPPNYLVSGYSKDWDKISLSSGWFMVESIGTDRVVSFDFADVLANLGTSVSVTNITTDIYITEKGISKKLSTSNKPTNSYRVDMSLFPVNISLKVELKKDDATTILLTKDISLGNMAVEKSFFKFEIKGFDIINTYKQEDVNQLVYAKMANISNYVEDLKSRNIIPNVAVMDAKIKKLEADVSQEQTFEIDRKLITLREFISDMYSKMDELARRLEKYEKL